MVLCIVHMQRPFSLHDLSADVMFDINVAYVCCSSS